jgi:putative drug exporter of the RND superfamily
MRAKGASVRLNLAERAGRWSAAHWKTATVIWVGFVAVAIALGAVAGTKKLTDAEQANGEAARAERVLLGAGFRDRATETVLVQSGSLTADDPAFRQTVRSVVGILRPQPEVKDLRSPLGRPAELVSRDRHSALVEFDVKGDVDTAGDRIQRVLDAVAAAQRTHSGFTIREFGRASAAHELGATIGHDLRHAEQLSVPITFVILLFAFGAFVAAGVPVLLAFSAVLASLGLAAVVSHVVHASDATSSVMLLMGMAVGVDYSLFYLKREREERAAGRDGGEALRRAAATSGQAVLVSGATVMIAMAGMLVAGDRTFTSVGVGAMLVVFVSMVGSLTVLPALLGKLGDRVDRGVVSVVAAGLARVLRVMQWEPPLLTRLKERRTLLHALRGTRSESRLWGIVLRPTLRFPVAAAALATGALVALAWPAFGMHTRLLSLGDLPQSLGIVKSYDAVQRAFPGAQTPAVVVVESRDVTARRVRAALADLRRRALATGVVNEPIHTAVSADRTVARIEIPLAGNGDDAQSVAALGVLRDRVLPAALGGLPRTEYAVTGETAGSHDFNQTVKHRAPLVFGFVLGLAFLLLLVSFRSIVVPLKAILLNLLSVGAAYGVLVWIFQDGHLQGLLKFRPNGAVVSWLPLFLFAVLFGLSMDYHVFVLSRVRELVDRGFSTEEAVSRAIRTTAGTVTSAAAVMVAVFAIFASLQTLDIKQMGVGLAVAVLVDATIIRGVLLPATMKLLGDWNWYLPRWLRWLPRLHVERASQEPALELR